MPCSGYFVSLSEAQPKDALVDRDLAGGTPLLGGRVFHALIRGAVRVQHAWPLEVGGRDPIPPPPPLPPASAPPWTPLEVGGREASRPRDPPRALPTAADVGGRDGNRRGPLRGYRQAGRRRRGQAADGHGGAAAAQAAAQAAAAQAAIPGTGEVEECTSRLPTGGNKIINRK